VQDNSEPRTSEAASPPTTPNVRRFYPLLVLAVILAIFALGAWTWVQFFTRDAGGNRTVLFTQTDFPAIVIASRLVASGHGAHLYDLNAQLQEQRRMIARGELALSPDDDLKYPYPYTPVIAVLWSALAALPPLSATVIWNLLNIAGMAFGLWFLLSTLPLPRFERLAVLLSGLTSFPFIVNLEQGQSSGIVMLGLGMGLGLLRRRQDFAGGLALGLLLVKVQWLPFLLLVLFWKLRWRTLLGVVLTALALMLVVVLVMGTAWIPDYVSVAMRAQQGARELLLDPWYSHGLTGGLVALLGRQAEGAARAINLIVTVVSAVLVLLVWRGKWVPSKARWGGAMALMVLAAMLTNAQLNTHDLCLLALPGALGLSYVRGAALPLRSVTVWYALLWLGYLASFFALLTQPVRVTALLIVCMFLWLAVLLARPTTQQTE
jgi:hypothetical protein